MHSKKGVDGVIGRIEKRKNAWIPGWFAVVLLRDEEEGCE
jgi:hypothetical protein